MSDGRKNPKDSVQGQKVFCLTMMQTLRNEHPCRVLRSQVQIEKGGKDRQAVSLFKEIDIYQKSIMCQGL